MFTEFFGASTLEAILLTLKLAFITSSLLLLIALPLAWFLANWQSKAKPLVMSILALPLVLPPTVLGFYLLIAFSPQSTLGQGWQSLTGSNLVFSFEGLVLGSVIYSLPFGLSFAHTIGEFGVVLMIGGNIPGETQVLSIALYEQVEALEYESAHNLALALLVFSFVMLAALYRFNGVTRSDEER